MDDMEKTIRKHKGESMAMSVETSVDWRGRPCKSNKHGGMTAAVFVLGLSLSLSFSRLSPSWFYTCKFVFTIFHIHLKLKNLS